MEQTTKKQEMTPMNKEDLTRLFDLLSDFEMHSYIKFHESTQFTNNLQWMRALKKSDFTKLHIHSVELLVQEEIEALTKKPAKKKLKKKLTAKR